MNDSNGVALEADDVVTLDASACAGGPAYCTDFQQTMEVKFDSSIAKGTGYDHLIGRYRSNPFDLSGNIPE